MDKHWQELEERIVRCKACPRLVGWREEVAQKKKLAYRDETYWGKPVPGFGDMNARVMVVGLAPGAYGSNRTGRMFTGDSSGNFLYPALYRAGFANQPESMGYGDGLELKGLFITAVCRCAPPENKPKPDEMENCATFMKQERDLLASSLTGMVALGKIAFDKTLAMYRKEGYVIPGFSFKHGEVYNLGDGLPWLVASYHPSRQNTQTGRLSVEMFDCIWLRVRDRIR